MQRLLSLIAVLLLIAGCASTPTEKVPDATVENVQPSAKVSLFSAGQVGGLPEGWLPMVIFRSKKQTQYQLVPQQDKTVLHAYSAGGVSGLMQKLSIDPTQQAWLSWQWKISQFKTKDQSELAAEDAPARIVLGFDGNKDTLPFVDQITFDTAKLVTGHDFPYATLMYVWQNKTSIGKVDPSRRSGRIKTMVVDNGPDGIGQWRQFTRNIIDDYRAAFGEAPGKLIGVGVITDTDNPDDTIEAWYGDIRLLKQQKEPALATGN